MRKKGGTNSEQWEHIFPPHTSRQAYALARNFTIAWQPEGLTISSRGNAKEIMGS